MKALLIAFFLLANLATAGQFSSTYKNLIKNNQTAASMINNEDMKKKMFSAMLTSMDKWIEAMKSANASFELDEEDQKVYDEAKRLAGK